MEEYAVNNVELSILEDVDDFLIDEELPFGLLEFFVDPHIDVALVEGETELDVPQRLRKILVLVDRLLQLQVVVVVPEELNQL